MKSEIKKLLHKCESAFTDYSNRCDDIAVHAKRYINVDSEIDISCEHKPSDGLCLIITDENPTSYSNINNGIYVCGCETFFKYVETHGIIKSLKELKHITI